MLESEVQELTWLCDPAAIRTDPVTSYADIPDPTIVTLDDAVVAPLPLTIVLMLA